MAVAVDATMTAGNSSNGTAQQASAVMSVTTSTGITVGASATLLVVVLSFDNNNGKPTSVGVTWNSVSMVKQANLAPLTSQESYVFSLVNPASGTKTLTASWSSFNSDVYMGAISFTGTDTTNGVQASDNTTASSTTSITVPSDTNGATVAIFSGTLGTPTMNFTSFMSDSALSGGSGASYNLGGTSNTHTFTGQGNGAMAGVHVISPNTATVLFEDDSYNANLVQFIEPIISVF